MKRKILWCGILILSCVVVVRISLAGLIDYDRLNKIRAEQAGSKTGKLDIDDKDIPTWFKVEPKVTIKDEQIYDVNRDGRLQTAEVKIMFRDLLDVVAEKGGAMYTSPIVKEYDKNKDGLINKYEAEDIARHVR